MFTTAPFWNETKNLDGMVAAHFEVDASGDSTPIKLRRKSWLTKFLQTAPCAVLVKALAQWKQSALATASTSSTQPLAPTVAHVKQLAQWTQSARHKHPVAKKSPDEVHRGFFYL
jgi:hypothetical protein